jgi:diacylglycerol kinase (ATP)
MQEPLDSAEEFSLMRRARSFVHAWRGVVLFFRTTPNAWIESIIFLSVAVLGYYMSITHVEWLVLFFAFGMVLVAEAFNTAIEIDINLTSPEFHPYARDTKDVAAGAVLIAACIAVCCAVLIFAPHVRALF